MKAVQSLTISPAVKDQGPFRRRRSASRCGALALVLASFALGGCAIEVGPPPESDPPLVPQKAKAPTPPPQPTEPQPWSRDLNLDSGPTRIDKEQLSQGLVASNSGTLYTGERLTFESAYNSETPPSEADLVRERARARAEAAGRPAPPEVAAAPVEEVSSQSLPPAPVPAGAREPDAPGEQARRESRLPPPPKFPPISQEAAVGPDSPPSDGAEATSTDAPAVPAAVEAEAPADSQGAVPPLPETAAAPISTGEREWRDSRLPPPPKFPPLSQEADSRAAADDQAMQQAALTTEEAPPEPSPAASAATDPQEAEAVPAEMAEAPSTAVAAADFAAQAWDAPAGTILVQVSAVRKEENVVAEWERLRARYPQILKPLRLVVEEAKLGDRGVFYRVQAGAFGTQAGADDACGVLIDAGQTCFVVVR